MSPRRVVITVISVAAVVLLLLSFVVSVKRQMGWIDAVTASVKRQTRWVFGIGFSPTVEQSPLAQWLVREEGTIQYDWRHVQGTSRTIWGSPGVRSHGSAPPIYSLRGGMLEHFVRASSDEELRRFVRIMRQGTEAEQEAAVDAAIEKALASIDEGR